MHTLILSFSSHTHISIWIFLPVFSCTCSFCSTWYFHLFHSIAQNLRYLINRHPRKHLLHEKYHIVLFKHPQNLGWEETGYIAMHTHIPRHWMHTRVSQAEWERQDQHYMVKLKQHLSHKILVLYKVIYTSVQRISGRWCGHILLLRLIFGDL